MNDSVLNLVLKALQRRIRKGIYLNNAYLHDARIAEKENNESKLHFYSHFVWIGQTLVASGKICHYTWS